MNSTILSVLIPCAFVAVHRLFEKNYRLRLQGKVVRQVRGKVMTDFRFKSCSPKPSPVVKREECKQHVERSLESGGG